MKCGHAHTASFQAGQCVVAGGGQLLHAASVAASVRMTFAGGEPVTIFEKSRRDTFAGVVCGQRERAG